MSTILYVLLLPLTGASAAAEWATIFLIGPPN